jgi:hypothetical protein
LALAGSLAKISVKKGFKGAREIAISYQRSAVRKKDKG